MSNISKLEGIEFAYIPKGGRVKMIAWGEDYKDWPCSRKVEYLETLTSALNEGFSTMQDERDAAVEELNKIKRLNESAAQAVAASKTSLIQGLTEANADKQVMAKRIAELEARVKAQDRVIEQLGGNHE